jgi:hypothetical protein
VQPVPGVRAHGLIDEQHRRTVGTSTAQGEQLTGSIMPDPPTPRRDGQLPVAIPGGLHPNGPGRTGRQLCGTTQQRRPICSGTGDRRSTPHRPALPDPDDDEHLPGFQRHHGGEGDGVQRAAATVSAVAATFCSHETLRRTCRPGFARSYPARPEPKRPLNDPRAGLRLRSCRSPLCGFLPFAVDLQTTSVSGIRGLSAGRADRCAKGGR